MKHWFYILVAIVGFIVFYSLTNQDNSEQKEHMLAGYTGENYQDNAKDIKLTVNVDRNNDPYYYDYGCRSYNCNRRRFWYGDTPFIWNNGTRWPRAPYYTALHDWYRDTYAYPNYWFYNY